MMMILEAGMLLCLAVYITFAYEATNNSLTEVPNDIPTSATTVYLGSNLISTLGGRLDHMANLQRL